jgi:hypothetical protein
MRDIGTLSVLEPLALSLRDSLLSTVNDLGNGFRSLPSKTCSYICERQSSRDITVTLTEGSGQQPDVDQLREKYDELVSLMENIPKTVPKGTKLGDLGWYLFWGQASVLAVGYAYSTVTGRSLIVTWSGELPRSQITPRPASPDEPIDGKTWGSLMQIFTKLKPAEIGSQTPHMEMKADGQSITASYLTAAGWVYRTFHVEAAAVYPPGLIELDMNMPFDGDEGTHPGGSSEEYFSDDDPINTPSASEPDDDETAQLEEVQPQQGQNRQST